MRLSLALAAPLTAGALLLTSCSAASAPAPTAAGSTAPSTAAAPKGEVVGAEVDKAAFIARVDAAAASAKTVTATTDLTMVINGKTQQMVTEVITDSTDKAKTRASMAMTVAGQPLKYVVDGDTFYVSIPGVAEGKWIKMTKAQLEQAGQTVPDVNAAANQFSSLSDDITKIVYVGPETVEGVATKHYTLTVGSSALGDLAGTGTATPAPDSGKTFPYDVWIDQADLVRQYKLAVEDASGSFTMTGKQGKYNEPVTITVPDPAQVMTLP